MQVDIRGKQCKARVVAMPFCASRAKEEPAVATHSPYDLRFSESHVWARADDRGEQVTLGLSDFGQRSLGDILCVDLPKVGERITKGAVVGWVDSYRKPFGIVSPITGEVVEINQALTDEPARMNAYPYFGSGLLKLRPDSSSEYAGLMRFESTAFAAAQTSNEWTKDRRIT